MIINTKIPAPTKKTYIQTQIDTKTKDTKTNTGTDKTQRQREKNTQTKKKWTRAKDEFTKMHIYTIRHKLLIYPQ